VVFCLGRGADCLYMVQLMPLYPRSKTPSSLASFKARLALSFRYRLTQAVLEKKPLNGCSSISSSSISSSSSSSKSTTVFPQHTSTKWLLVMSVCVQAALKCGSSLYFWRRRLTTDSIEHTCSLEG